jgi:hypothetical protein
MKHSLLVVLLVVAAGTVAPSAHADDIVFICHKGLHYDRSEVRLAYRGLLDEPHVVDNAALFGGLLKFLGVTSAKYRKLWERNYFRRGLVMPKLKHSDEAVIDFVASHSTGIGYVSAAPNNPEVEVCGR